MKLYPEVGDLCDFVGAQNDMKIDYEKVYQADTEASQHRDIMTIYLMLSLVTEWRLVIGTLTYCNSIYSSPLSSYAVVL